MRKIYVGLAAAAVIAAPLAATTSAKAAVGGEYVQNGGFGDVPANVLDSGSSTDFTPANLNLFGEWTNRDRGTMYDPGTFTIASNPASLHEFWADFPGDDQMMVVNGHTEGIHTVWEQTVDTRAAVKSSTHPLLAGQTNDVGTVTVTPQDDGKWCVKYDLSAQAEDDGWRINQIHIATAANEDGIPQNKGGVPQPGQFPVNESYSPGVTEQEICDVPAGEVFAAHASLAKVVDGVVVKTDTGWTPGSRFVTTNWSTYSTYTPRIAFKFSMNATNVLRPGIVPGEAGAKLEVSLNGNPIGTADLTGLNPGNEVVLNGDVADTDEVKIEINNLATEYSGNDFAIDDISLVQVP